MSEQPSSRNELDGSVGGHVVQAGAIHGDVVLPASSALTPDEAELRRRSVQRELRRLDEEDAARERQETERRRRQERRQKERAEYLNVVRRKHRRYVILLVLTAATGVWVTVEADGMAGWAGACWLAIFTLLMSNLWWPRWKVLRDVKAGRAVQVPADRGTW
ncbi:hypothetical protein [Streptomyces cacaoi]|uniref:hypothetical protein n=1 Tax=Streptomyces cacaoi TaxID=1898 RepID=UPI00374A9008